MIDFDKLRAPFPPDAVSWRVGSTTQDKSKGMALAYLDARDVMARLDDVCGPDGWERRHPHVDKTTTCEIAIWVEGRGWVVKADGAGDTQVEAEKGSLSDSFKRAAVNWGIGRYLYDVQSPWVELEAAGRSYKIKDSELKKLRDVLINGAPKPQPPKAPSVAATAAMTAITMANDHATLDKWKVANKAALAQMSAEDQDTVIRHWKSRWRAVTPTDDTFPGNAPRGVALSANNTAAGVQ